jgi:hypothetical protein
VATDKTTIDFGATPTDTATILVVGLSGLTINSHLEPWIQGSDSTGDNSSDAHGQLASRSTCWCEYVSGTTMNIMCDVSIGFVTGTFTIHYATA